MKYLLFNPKSKNGKSSEVVENIRKENENLEEISVLDKETYLNVYSKLTKDDEVLLVGGDGTLNHFINEFKDKEFPCKVYMYASGTGNDFFNDVKDKVENNRVLLNDLIKNLPTVKVNDKKYLFINGVGYGIDGYCCEKGDELQAKSDKPVNYTGIAIKGLLFHYKAPNAKVTVDGITKEYKRVWLAPTMKGKYYGGGMMVAPNQDRENKDNSVTTVVMHGSGKLKTLMVFPSIFKGEHVKHTKMVDVMVGHHVVVEFDKPTALQIDGETIKNVTKYEVNA